MNPPVIDPSTGKYAKAHGDDAIQESITNLCMTGVGELPMNEDVGVDAEASLFESVVASMDILPLAFVGVIRRHERRVANVTAKARQNPDTGAVEIEIFFKKRSSGTAGSTTITNSFTGETG